jgi:hypothetical protein
MNTITAIPRQDRINIFEHLTEEELGQALVAWTHGTSTNANRSSGLRTFCKYKGLSPEVTESASGYTGEFAKFLKAEIGVETMEEVDLLLKGKNIFDLIEPSAIKAWVSARNAVSRSSAAPMPKNYVRPTNREQLRQELLKLMQGEAWRQACTEQHDVVVLLKWAAQSLRD